jgi:hypothetical protein
MLTKLVVGILKKYDIYHTSLFSILINQKRILNHRFSLHTSSIIITHYRNKTHYRNGTQGHNDGRNKR